MSVVANGSGPRRGGLAAFLTILAVVGLIAFVAIAINTFDTEEQVQAVGPAASSQANAPEPAQAPPPAAAPVGGVATGGGGAAAGSGSGLAAPVVGALGALTLLAVAQMVRRPRRA